MRPKNVNKLSLFEGRRIRKVFHEVDWWFSIIDVIEALVGGDSPRKYWNDLKKKLLQEGYDQLSEKIGQLKMRSSDGKFYATDCANTETLFRIIQSIPSPKVEPLKRWLARVGKERIDEIENPELAMGRMQGLYEKKGYPKEWIDKRLRGIAVRQYLTDSDHCIAEDHLWAFLTATQSETLKKLKDDYGTDAREEIFRALRKELEHTPLWMILRGGLKVRGMELSSIFLRRSCNGAFGDSDREVEGLLSHKTYVIKKYR